MIECKGDNILFELPDVANTTEGGIIKPEEVIAEEAAQQDELDSVVVFAVGDEVRRCTKGDEIIISSPRIAVYTINGKRYGGVKDYDVVCVIR